MKALTGRYILYSTMQRPGPADEYFSTGDIIRRAADDLAVSCDAENYSRIKLGSRSTPVCGRNKLATTEARPTSSRMGVKHHTDSVLMARRAMISTGVMSKLRYQAPSDRCRRAGSGMQLALPLCQTKQNDLSNIKVTCYPSDPQDSLKLARELGKQPATDGR